MWTIQNEHAGRASILPTTLGPRTKVVHLGTPMNMQTGMTENITFPQTTHADGKNCYYATKNDSI